ncbi:hypothetical protein MWN52_14910 [Pseudoxanthomonas winnipegensis]|uniref:hypothetical protein n=1 Tax=Pseudoxanthomonas winnipegensis TaxID=2480810 RepID=UPI00257561D2|nr:hypothetical protein [Pseudoxanthomonas winnipegensis]WJI14903.1 hypothetical protein MWN52_14910 [Pseudoxanthomonas winnipegensis]
MTARLKAKGESGAMKVRRQLTALLSAAMALLFVGLVASNHRDERTSITSAFSEVSRDQGVSLAIGKSAMATQGALPSADLHGRYDLVRRCIAYFQFGALMERRKNDPDFGLNNPAAMEMLPVSEQERLIRNKAIVEEGDQACEKYRGPAYAELLRAVYDVSAKLADAGDLRAATCFIEASWGTPVDPSAEYVALARAYKANAKRYADQGIMRGDWRSAIAAFDAGQAEHGITTLIGYSIAEKYALARLLQMGSSDPDQSARYAYDAEVLASTMTAADLAREDVRARQLYGTRFRGKPMPDSALSQGCEI